jgi:GDPmannose 4,6-dehydratase
VRALITGITGQDGSYLAEMLGSAGHKVFGLVRGQNNPRRAWLERLVPEAQLLDGDMLDSGSLIRAIERAQPDVVFNLAATTQIGMSWGQPELMTGVTGLGVLRLLEAVRIVAPAARVVQASSADMFGEVRYRLGQNEETPIDPTSPYGAAKAFAHQLCRQYREGHGMSVSTAIMFNHTSPRHGEEFVVRKVIRAAVSIARGEQEGLWLGDTSPQRDWGWAPDFMAAWPLIAQAEPGDFVLATGEAFALWVLCQKAFAAVGLDWREHVHRDPRFVRPLDVRVRLGEPSKAARVLGWKPTTDFDTIVRRLVVAEQETRAGRAAA